MEIKGVFVTGLKISKTHYSISTPFLLLPCWLLALHTFLTSFLFYGYPSLSGFDTPFLYLWGSSMARRLVLW
jgi:hypothetical protein